MAVIDSRASRSVSATSGATRGKIDHPLQDRFRPLWGEIGSRGRGHLVTHFWEKNVPATVAKCVGHWSRIKATAAEQCQLWRDVVGEALLARCGGSAWTACTEHSGRSPSPLAAPVHVFTQPRPPDSWAIV